MKYSYYFSKVQSAVGPQTSKIVQQTLDLRNSIFPFLNREMFDLRKIYVVNLNTGRSKKMPCVDEFAT